MAFNKLGEVKDHTKAKEEEIYATQIANPDYWDEKYPKIRKIEFVKYSPKNALKALIEGQVDLVTSLMPKDTLKVEESPHSKVVKVRQDVNNTAGYFNLMSPQTFLLRISRVREALNYAVNKQELMLYAFKGNAVDIKGVLSGKSGVDLFDTEPYDWSITEARRLLKKAGYEDGFKMKLMYEEKDYLIALLLQRFYSLLKIEVEIVPSSMSGLSSTSYIPIPVRATHGKMKIGG